MSVQSELLKSIPGIQHAFGTRKDPVPKIFLKSWVELRPNWQQVHKTGIVDVLRKNQECGETDALFTKTKNPIAVVTADCVPILLARKDGGAVAAIHSGWRGTMAKFVEVFAEKLRKQGESPSDYVAALGPSIQKCCYTVGQDLIDDFYKNFPHLDQDLISPAERKLDLAAINEAELKRLGFGAIERIPYCTYCFIQDRGATFHSYRREGAGTRQWSLISRL